MTSDRPLSPHLGIYKFAHTMALSIAHRFSGMGLSLGLIALIWWLMALAAGDYAYGRFVGHATHWLFKLLLLAWLLAFCYHLANGIRHLFWDAGLGLERSQARRSAVVVLMGALALFALSCGLLFAGWKLAP